MNLIPGETQRWREALNAQLFFCGMGGTCAAPNDWSATDGMLNVDWVSVAVGNCARLK